MDSRIKQFAERGCAWDSEEVFSYVALLYGTDTGNDNLWDEHLIVPDYYFEWRDSIERALGAVDGETDESVQRARYWAFRWWAGGLPTTDFDALIYEGSVFGAPMRVVTEMKKAKAKQDMLHDV